MRAVRSELLSGCGLYLLRGMPVESWGVATSAAAFWLLGLCLGAPLPQNRAGHALGHVKDIGGDPARPETRLYTTSAAQPYHTDSADIVSTQRDASGGCLTCVFRSADASYHAQVGLLCLAQARSGGDSHVVSSAAVYNEARLCVLCNACLLDACRMRRVEMHA